MALPSTYTDWQTKAGSPAAGVGDLDDLQIALTTADSGRWVARIKPGWFYADLEQYSYVSKQTVTATLSAISGSVTAPLSFRPAWGPVFVYESTGTVYTEHHNCYQPGVAVTWTRIGSTNVFSTNVPTGQVVLGVRDLTTIPLALENSQAEVQDPKSYFYNSSTGDVYVYSTEAATGVTRFLDLMNYSPRLRIREVLTEVGTGLVYTSYKNIKSAVLYRGRASETIGDSTTGALNHSLTASKGDWIVAEYYINKSFILSNHNKLYAYTGVSSGATLTVDYEGSSPEYPATAVQNSPVSGAVFQFNPLFSDAFRVGYLYHTTETTSGTPTSISLDIDKDAVTGAWREMFKATIKVTDKDGLPIPQTTVSLTHNLAATGTTALMPTALTSTASSYTVKTDNRGEIHWLLTPGTVSSSGTLILTATAGSTFASGSVLNLPVSGTLTSSHYNQGIINVVQSNLRTSKGYSKLYASPHYLDGIPKPAPNGLNISTEKSSALQSQDLSRTENITFGQATVIVPSLISNPFRIAGLTEEIGVGVAGTDRMFATAGGGQSPLVTIQEEK